MRDKVLLHITNIPPWDDIEREHIQFAREWILSDAPLCRVQKPNLPDIHLVSYFVVIDFVCGKILLGEHNAANLWLPSGGHVEPDELPLDAAKRECREELQMEPEFFSLEPFFVTVSHLNEKGLHHKDVSLWYLLKGDSKKIPQFCDEEYRSMQWFDLRNLPPLNQSDPNIERFRNKLLARILHYTVQPDSITGIAMVGQGR